VKRLNKWFFLIGSALLVVGGILVALVAYLNSSQRAVPLVFSNQAMLLQTYNEYKKDDIQPSSGRTVDKTQNNLTTSEGESYTMLRAVYMDDKSTFDKSWNFTKNNLQRPDHLFSWKYGSLGNGKYGILTSEGGQNTASDGDEDIALALLMAYSRWNQTSYLQAAQPIVTSMWNEEVVMIDGKPVLTADNLERKSSEVVVDPSYFAPANYKIFAKIDPTHDWLGLASNSYTLIDGLSASKLGSTKSDGLPPDWIKIDRTTGAFIPNASPNLDTNFGYDAERIPFRLALDYAWFKDPRDLQTLKHFSFLKDFWNNAHVLNAVYAHDGTVVGSYEAPSMYGGTIGYFDLIDPSVAKQIYRTKLETLYSPDQESWKAPAPNYYDDNWAWFGLAITQGALPDIADNH
jgi:endo-1,4-beta-D-glucanase Y